MTPVALSPIFRRGMLPLVIGVALVVAVAAPLAFHLQRRHELSLETAEAAQRVAALVEEVARERPVLWRYDAAKISERLLSEGIDRELAVRLWDANGRPIAIEQSGAASRRVRRLWARSPIQLARRKVATVAVGADLSPLWLMTLALVLAFATLAGVLGTLLYLLPMRTVRRAERHIEALMNQLALATREDDRRRIARDLHDGVGQALTAARLQLLALGGHNRPAALAVIGKHLDEALDEVRRATNALMPAALSDLGLAGAIEQHCLAFGAAVGLRVHCQIDDLPELQARMETELYRIAQEALTNTARHALATEAWVRLRLVDGQIELGIADNGIGVVEGRLALDTIRERIQLIGGSLTISRPAGMGLELGVTAPVSRMGSLDPRRDRRRPRDRARRPARGRSPPSPTCWWSRRWPMGARRSRRCFITRPTSCSSI